MALIGIPISDEQCIGDSLVTINDSFTELDLRSLNLSSFCLSLSSTVAANSINSSKLKFTGTGAQTSFDVSSLVGSVTNAFLYRVDLNGVVQEPGTNGADGDYYISSGNLIFSTAPGSGVKIVVIGPDFV